MCIGQNPHPAAIHADCRERRFDGNIEGIPIFMKIGMIGLGRMGANMARSLMRGGQQCVGFDRNAANVTGLVGLGAMGAALAGGPGGETGGAARSVDNGA